MTPKNSNDKTELALIRQDIQYIKTDVTDIKHKLDGEYVTRMEFDPIRKIVYGVVTIVLTAVVGGLVALVVYK
jgi:hypothetical protein